MKSFFKIRSTLFSALVLCTLFSPLYAQRHAPGYMGKRFLLKYDQGIGWSIGKDIRAIPNLLYTLQADHAVTLKYAVGAEYSFMTRKYGKELGYANYNVDQYYRLDRTFMHRVGVYTKLFSQHNGHIAPAGPYLCVGLNLYLVQGKFTRYGNPAYMGKGAAVNQLSFDIGPSIGGGKQYIVGKRLVLSLDMRFTIPLIGIARTLNHAVDIETINGQASYTRLALNRWTLWPNAQANILVIRMGIGTLL